MNDRSLVLERQGVAWFGRFRAMASPCELLCEVPDRAGALRLANEVAAIAWAVEDKFSRYLPGNIIDRINNADGQPVEVDAETADLLDFCAEVHRLSDGRFDITSGVLRRVWRFDGGDRLPGQAEIDAALADVGWHKASWRAPVLTLAPGMQIDLGGVGKEYAVDRAAAHCREAVAQSCLVNFGGDLAVSRPRAGGASWQVGIEQIDDDGKPVVVRLRDGALATSGDSRRYLLHDGVRYSHILDPVSGWPVAGAPHSVTVLSQTCTQAGMLATLASLQGAGAEAFLAAQEVACWIQR